ncbi:MAG: hypothetical protein MUO26_08080 [Methanotrichaceae archaeon]|nr:hypothetical protein [Methanotrichaceae archaeon]
MILYYTKIAQEMTGYIAKALKQASHEATVLLYSPGIDPFIEEIAKSAETICFTSRKAHELHPD